MQSVVQWRSGTVVAVGRSRCGAVELTVEIEDLSLVRAFPNPSAAGVPVVGDRVLLNVGALTVGPCTVESLREFAERFSDLTRPDVTREAWH